MKRFGASLLLAALAVGCEQSARAPQTARGSESVPGNPRSSQVATQRSPIVPITTPPEPADPMAATSAAGNWLSTRCGARTYERRLNLSADGTFTAEDLVSPCPEGAQCGWSGIETRRGKWKQGAKILLLREEPSAAKMGPAFPLELDWDGRLREGSCDYERAPAAK